MLFIATAAGIVGTIVMGLRGLTAGSAGELDRILALGFLFIAAASLLGIRIDDGRRPKTARVLTMSEGFLLLVASPLILLMLGVFLATLIPSIYVMLPIFAVWHYTSRTRPVSPPRATPQPAYAR
jgi:hypothetical protein